MSSMGWTRRSSNVKPKRISNTQYAMDLASNRPRASRSVERQSKIPTRSSSQSGRQMGKPQMPQRSKSTLGDTPVSGGYTPQPFGSRVTPSSNIAKKIHVKDPRNLQDKEFLKEANYLVQNFFQQNCREILIQGTDIRPMTIKMFINMINHLFAALGILDKGKEPVIFAVSTYEKEIPYWMKKLEYPGLITKAWLQTVNVPNNWPHVVGLLSWFVKLTICASLFNLEEELEPVDSEDSPHAWNIQLFQRSLTGYVYFSEDQVEESAQLKNELVGKFYEINGIDEKVIAEMETEIEQLQEQLQDPSLLALKDSMDESEQRLRVARAQYQKSLDDVANENDLIEETKSKILKKQRNCLNIKQEIERIKKRNEDLKKIVSAQAISVVEIVEIQKKSDYLNKEIMCLEKECEDYSQLVSRYEFEAVGKRDQILQTTHKFNRHVIQLEQLIPELKDFHIHMDPENEKIVVEMEKLVKSLELLRSNFKSQLEELEEQCIEYQRAVENKKLKLKQITDAIQAMKKKNATSKSENEELKKNFEEKEKTLRVEADEWSGKVKTLQEKLKEIEDLREKKKSLDERYEGLGKALEHVQELEEQFWTRVADKFRHIPEDLDVVLNNINLQNADIKKRYQHLLDTFEAQANSKEIP